MRWRSRFLQAFGRVAIPNITLYLIVFQVLCFLMIVGQPAAHFDEKLVFSAGRVMDGEWWRVLTFLFLPPSHDVLWAFVGWYFFWWVGSALEASWGTVSYNLYLWIGALATIGSGFAAHALGAPDTPGTNAYIGETVFLAFSTLYPETQILLMMIIPVRAKWLALAAALVMGLQFLEAEWIGKAMLLAAVANYLIFFRGDILNLFQRGKSRVRQRLRQNALYVAPSGDAMHRCAVCGATEKSNPDVEFRYCSECGGKCYCLTHLREHQHVR